MSVIGFVSAVNSSLSLQIRNQCSSYSSQRCFVNVNSECNNLLAFRSSDSMGLHLRMPTSRLMRTRTRQEVVPFKAVCMDYPRPELEDTANFSEAAYLSSSFRNSARPSRPLQVVIARAVGLHMLHMEKGQALLNGEPIGRYCPRTSSIYDECPPKCNYRGKFTPNKYSRGCEKPTQR